jgi:uncharacterized membrane protein
MLDELFALAILLLIALLIVLLIFRVLRETFNSLELFLIISCPVISMIAFMMELDTSIGIFTMGGTLFKIDVVGAVIPLIIGSALMIRSRRKIGLKELFLTMIVVAMSAYAVTEVSVEGVVSRFPLYLIPPLTATMVSFMVTPYPSSGRLAYSASVFGVLIGADLLRIAEIANYGSISTAIIGGARVGDMIFISGILAVLMSSLVAPFKREKHETE